jgi:hypothetical protein
LSLAAGASVFAIFCTLGVVLFGASDDASEAFEDTEPVLVNLDIPTDTASRTSAAPQASRLSEPVADASSANPSVLWFAP